MTPQTIRLRRALVVILAGIALSACGGTSSPAGRAANAVESSPPTVGLPAVAQSGAPDAVQTPGSAPRAVSVALAYTTTNAGTAPMWLAQEAGLFREQGLETSLVRIPAGTPMLAALQNRDVVVAMAGGPAIVDAVLHGGDQVIVGSLTNYHNQALYGAASYGTVESLQGQAVGVSRYGASSDVAGREALRRAGLEPGRDVA